MANRFLEVYKGQASEVVNKNGIHFASLSKEVSFVLAHKTGNWRFQLVHQDALISLLAFPFVLHNRLVARS